MREREAMEQVAFIRQVIDDSQGVMVEGGAYYVLWGALVVAGSALTYAALAAGLQHLIVWIWASAYALGAGGVLLLNRRRGGGRPRTLARRVYVSIWTAVAICGAVFAACAILSGKVPLEAALSLVTGLLGTAYFINARLNASRWMLALSLGWWVGTALFYAMPPKASPLLLGALVFGLELVPGIVLCARRRRGSSAQR